MRVLRGLQPVTKVTVVFLLALNTASTFVIATPRPAQAEGFLLDTVRCLVRTVLVEGCRTAPAPAPTPSPAPQSNGNAAPPPASSNNTSSEQASTPSASRTYSAPSSFETITPPEASTSAYPTIEEVERPGVNPADRLSESEYVAYFNAYSPYAVQGAQTADDSVVQASPEGWKLFGIQWYWWGLAAAFIFALFLSVKYGILRRPSVLSGGK